jgi:hypothetical protein
MDDTFVKVVHKEEIMFFKLYGAPECHAPELALELERAKREVRLGYATVYLWHRAHCLTCYVVFLWFS